MSLEHGIVHDSLAGQRRRDLGRLKDRFAHIDANAIDMLVLDFQFEREHAAAGLDLERGDTADVVVIDVLGHAAHSVAAHFAFRSVGVEHSHASVGHRRGADENQAVATYAEMAVGDFASELVGVRRERFFEAIDVNVVVSRAMHFGELHRTAIWQAVSAGGKRNLGS